MIALNETEEYAAEIPFTLPLASDPLTGLTGWAFTLGEVQIRRPGGGSWTNIATAKIIEKGYGRFCARLNSTQTTTAGVVALRANIAGSTEQPYFGTETIGVTGGDIPVDGTGHLIFYLPDAVDPVYGIPVDAANFVTGGTVRICLPNGSYRDATDAEKSAIQNLGGGGYAFPLDVSHTATRGKVFLYIEYPGAQRFESYWTILGVGTAPVVVAPPPTPVPTPVPVTSPTYVNHIRAAVGRLPQQFRSGSYIPATVTLDTILNS